MNTIAAVRQGRRLEVLTLVWNSVEAAVSIAAGVAAGSTALIGFGVDSAIESSSGAALLWRLQHHDERGEAREALALKLVGIAFVLLAVYVGYEAVEALIRREPPDASIPGIIIASVSLIVMPWLARRKRRVAAVINSRALEKDSRQTDLCAYLSAILLGGLLLNALLGWWWADPLAALVMVPIIVNEGREALSGEKDCCD